MNRTPLAQVIRIVMLALARREPLLTPAPLMIEETDNHPCRP